MSDVTNYLIGSTARISAEISNAAGALVDPSTLNLVITDPSGALTPHAIGAYAHDSTGKYHFDVPLTDTGVWAWQQESTSPDGVWYAEARVVEPGDSFIRLASYRAFTNDLISDIADVIAALEDALSYVEKEAARKFKNDTYTETLPIHRNGRVYPTAVPIGSVIPVGATFDSTSIDVGPTTAFNLFSTGVHTTSVTYVGGYEQNGVPVPLGKLISRIAYQQLHPTTLNVPAGATSVSVGDVSVSGGRLGGLLAVDPGITREIRRWKLPKGTP